MADRRRWAERAMMLLALAGLAWFAWSLWDREALVAWAERARPLPFFAVMALLSVVGVPITPFFLLAGATFGAKVALLGSLIALALNLLVCYRLARLLRPRLERLTQRLGYRLPDLKQRERSTLGFTAAVKLAPGVPAFVKSYGLALARVPFGVYFGVSMLITGAYAASLILLGASLFQHDRNRTLLAAGVLGLVVLALWAWRRRRGGP
jgi:uncharacterized membrane protein YdjX (TVP38/TMEM64 family)